MLSSKQRAFLRSISNGLSPVFQVGKAGVTPEFVASVDEALEKRELVKISILQSCEDAPKDVAETVRGRTRSDLVQVIGGKFVLYRKAKKAVIDLPKQ